MFLSQLSYLKTLTPHIRLFMHFLLHMKKKNPLGCADHQVMVVAVLLAPLAAASLKLQAMLPVKPLVQE